ncbi:MAG: hypothetical protein U0470_04575 [Anaerolineae bacterium]
MRCDRRGFLTATGPALGAPACQSAGWDDAGRPRVYLPRLDAGSPSAPDGAFETVPCSMVADPCLLAGWRIVCGGLGRVRDAGRPRSGRRRRGGGVVRPRPRRRRRRRGRRAQRRVDRLDGGDRRRSRRPQPCHRRQRRHELGGGRRGADRPAARRRGRCWSVAASGWPTATLQSIELKTSAAPSFGGDLRPPGIGGWAVGRAIEGAGPSARSAAMIAQLDIARTPPLWRHLTRDADGPLALPPLSDVQLVPTVDGGQQIWAIGQAGAEGAGPDAAGRGAVDVADRPGSAPLDGYLTELVMRSDRSGWAFGTAAGAGRAAAVWRLEGGRRRAPTMLHEGQCAARRLPHGLRDRRVRPDAGRYRRAGRA